jgi:hypothetical protein
MVFPVTDLVVSFSGRAGVYRPRAKNPTPRPRRAGCGLRGRLGSVHARQQGGNSSTCPSPDRGPTARLLRARPASSRAHARFGSIQISKTERERGVKRVKKKIHSTRICTAGPSRLSRGGRRGTIEFECSLVDDGRGGRR